MQPPAISRSRRVISPWMPASSRKIALSLLVQPGDPGAGLEAGELAPGSGATLGLLLLILGELLVLLRLLFRVDPALPERLVLFGCRLGGSGFRRVAAGGGRSGPARHAAQARTRDFFRFPAVRRRTVRVLDLPVRPDVLVELLRGGRQGGDHRRSEHEHEPHGRIHDIVLTGAIGEP